MKLWFVVTIFGQVAAAIGPLPYDMAECLNRLPAYQILVPAQIGAEPSVSVDGRKVTPADVALSCTQSDVRPSTNGMPL